MVQRPSHVLSVSPHVWCSALGSCVLNAVALWSSEMWGRWHWSTHTHTRPQVSPLIHSLQGYTHTHTHTHTHTLKHSCICHFTKLLPSLVTVANLDKLYLTSCGNEMKISVNSMIFSQMCLLSLSKIYLILFHYFMCFNLLCLII